jgi:small conductance mechanosensitive channel
LTPDNKRIILPNGALTNAVIKNYSAEELRRVDFTFGAAYGCDVEKVKTVIEEVVKAHPLALQDPEPFVRLSSHDESALTYTVRVWVKNADYWTVNFDVIEGVKKAFDENGIEIPFNQLDVHVKND